jgi:hypothetical protein
VGQAAEAGGRHLLGDRGVPVDHVDPADRQLARVGRRQGAELPIELVARLAPLGPEVEHGHLAGDRDQRHHPAVVDQVDDVVAGAGRRRLAAVAVLVVAVLVMAVLVVAVLVVMIMIVIVVVLVGVGAGPAAADREPQADLDQRRVVELAADHPGDDRHLDADPELGAAADRARQGAAGHEIEPALVALVVVDDAAPALGGLARGVEGQGGAEAAADPGGHGGAAGVAIAGLVVARRGVDHLHGQGVERQVEATEGGAGVERQHRVDRAGAELDVLVRQAGVAAGERIGLGLAERQRQAGAAAEREAAERPAVAGQEPRIAGAEQRLVPVMDVGAGQGDLLAAGRVAVGDAGRHQAQRHNQGDAEPVGHAVVGVEPELAEGDRLVVDDVGRPAAHHVVAIVVGGGQPGRRGRDLDRQLTGRADRAALPPDREVGIASTRSSAAGGGALHPAEQHQHEDDGGTAHGVVISARPGRRHWNPDGLSDRPR